MGFARHVLLVASVLVATIVPPLAQEYPVRPVRILVPYPAGGPSDTSARFLGEALSRQLGQPVIVENRSGGAGLTGTEAALRSPHDGYTLLIGGPATLVLLPAAKPGIYNVATDFIPLTQTWSAPQVLAVRKDLSIGSASELVAYARKNPGKLTFASAGIGSITHLALMLFEKEAGISITHVPYRSTALWLADAAGGRIDGAFGDIGTLGPHIEAGTIRALAAALPQRAASLPDVPTFDEIGLPGVQTETWFGVLALGKTPPEIVSRLRTAIRAAQSDPDYLAALKKVGGDGGQQGHEALARLIAGDTQRLAPIMKAIAASK